MSLDVTPDDQLSSTERVPVVPGVSSIEQYFRAVVQNATDLVTINDRYGIVRYMSPSVTRILGYSLRSGSGITASNCYTRLIFNA
ncbi:PAS domain S-box protein [Candidatus Gracilibacteria bacterium]|nr:PAS domain S-box protein [Candidatus Gracilibacteria bacterium]